jgi:alkanesulfonate monooxygenase SsuD/methylene tetrahydromethanopterin reductase-like flavin-dependent oxidoreductase (luciferase family)
MPKIGVVLPMFSGDAAKVLARAQEAERLGLDGVFAFDHFFPPGGRSDLPALEAFTTLAMVAGGTKTLMVGTLVTRTVLRPAGGLAQVALGVHLVSGGRMILGVGSGDPLDHPEHVAFGFPEQDVAERREHLGETVEAVRALFAGRSYPGGRQTPAITGPLLPGPDRRPLGPPVWIGGQSDVVVDLAGRLADGWNGWGMGVPKFARKSRLLADTAEAAGRTVEATWAGIVLVGEDQAEADRLVARRNERGMETVAWSGPAEAFGDHVRTLEKAGATWVIVVPAGPADRLELMAGRSFGLGSATDRPSILPSP